MGSTPKELIKWYTRGERLRAADVNGFAAAIRALALGDPMPHPPRFRTHRGDADTVPFSNGFAGECPDGALLRITGPTTIDGEEGFTVTKPSADLQQRYLVNTGGKVPQSGKGRGSWLLDYADDALYDSGAGAPAQGARWGPKDAEWALFKDRPGFVVDFVSDSTAKTVRVRQQQLEYALLFGKTDTSIVGNGTATVSVWYKPIGGTEADTGLQVQGVRLRTGYVAASAPVLFNWAGAGGEPEIVKGHSAGVIVLPDSNQSVGSSVTCSIQNDMSGGNPVDTGDNVSCYCWHDMFTDRYAWAWQEEKSGLWLVRDLECT